MAIQTRCKNCGDISPITTDICDKCGCMEFVPFDSGETRSIKQILAAKSLEEKKEQSAGDIKITEPKVEEAKTKKKK